MTLPARLTWKDQRGATRFARVLVRNVSDYGVYVECQSPVSIPLFRLVQFQLERDARDVGCAPRLAATGPRARRGLSRLAAKGLAAAGTGAQADGRSAADGGRPRRRRATHLRYSRMHSIQSQSASLPQYLASPRQFKSNRPATSYARLPTRSSGAAIRGAVPPRTTASRSSSLPGLASDALTRLAVSSRCDAISVRCAPTGACGPKCVRKIVSARHSAMRRRLSRQASRSMSGGGVGGRTKPPG